MTLHRWQRAMYLWRLLSLAMQSILDHFPEGRPIPTAVWNRRHRIIVRLVWLHAVVLLAASILVSAVDPVGIAGSLAIGILGVVANQDRGGQRLRGSMACIGLLSASAIMVHLSGGYIEMHFHFFVALAIIAFYQEWVVFLVAITFVLLEHGVIGVLFPTAVYNHHAAQTNPWLWAGIHAVFVAGASVANLFGWRVNEQQSLHDPLTRLPNRELFRDRADHALLRARRHTLHVAVMFVDLDRFKPINDTWGHHVGDTVLLELAERLSKTIRVEDTVARLGGDEFAVLLEELDDPGEASRIARRIQDSLRAPVIIQGRPISLRASIGIALNDDPDVAVDELIRDADMAMYSAKKRGGGRSVLFKSSMRAGVADRLDLEMELRRAVSAQHFRVEYQPTVALPHGELVGVEALLRWNHKTRGEISPAVFIPLAEETGLIVPLGLWVLEQACRQAVAWHVGFPDRPPLTVSVNVSAIQLGRESFVQDVKRILRQTGVKPSTITLELTESALMDDADATTDALKQLKGLGVRLAIDDFGTGYSSLSYLQRLPIDILKIDRSFVDRIQQGAEELAFARAIVDLARSLSLSTIAEGIELESQADRLSELGCDRGQGFLYARAAPPDEISRLLATSEGQLLAS